MEDLICLLATGRTLKAGLLTMLLKLEVVIKITSIV